MDKVFEYGYDQQAWTCEQIIHKTAEKLFDPGYYHGSFLRMREPAQQEKLAGALRAERHLLMLDNLESITGSSLSIPNTLPEPELAKLKSFLKRLVGGKTLVLFGSRTDEQWLAEGTFGNNVYLLGGLDPEAASDLAEKVLEAHQATQYWEDQDLHALINLLDGYPLALEVVLANLSRQTPKEVLEGIRQGLEGLDNNDPQDKTKSIIRCIEYSYNELSPETRAMIVCLAPFTGVIAGPFLEHYTQQLKAQTALADLPFDHFEDVLEEAIRWGLLTPDPDDARLLRVQPVLPYFLKTRLHGDDQRHQAVDTAFRAFYEEYAREIYALLHSDEPGARELGRMLNSLEYTNLVTALELALKTQASIMYLYYALSTFFDETNDDARGLALGEKVLKVLQHYPNAASGESGLELSSVIDNIGTRQFNLNHYSDAKISYRRALSLFEQNMAYPPETRRKENAKIYHRLGVIAQTEGEWEQAEELYHMALAINTEFNDRYEQAINLEMLGKLAQAQRHREKAEEYFKHALTLHIGTNNRPGQASIYYSLGLLEEEQRHWKAAETYYKKTLAIQVEFNERYSQASTYHQLGIVVLEQGQRARAEEYFREALAIYIEFNDRGEQADCYHELGLIAQWEHQWAQAEEYYRKALEILIEFNNRSKQADTYHQLGRVAEGRQQWAQAEKYYHDALAIFIERNERDAQVRPYHQLGIVAQEQKQWEKARDFLLQALEISHEFADQPMTGTCLQTLAGLWKQTSDTTLPQDVARVLNADATEIENLFRRLADEV